MKQLTEEFYRELEEIQAADFVIVDLALYLNTHPDDLDAVNQYNQYVQKSLGLKKIFEQKYGPMTSFGYSFSGYPWNYKDAPWPWQV